MTGSNRAADAVHRLLEWTKYNPYAAFRVIVPCIYGSGRGFTRILVDESFDYGIPMYNEWYNNSVIPRLIPNGEIRAFAA